MPELLVVLLCTNGYLKTADAFTFPIRTEEMFLPCKPVLRLFR